MTQLKCSSEKAHSSDGPVDNNAVQSWWWIHLSGVRSGLFVFFPHMILGCIQSLAKMTSVYFGKLTVNKKI